jgi:hypothetical protein
VIATTLGRQPVQQNQELARPSTRTAISAEVVIVALVALKIISTRIQSLQARVLHDFFQHSKAQVFDDYS